MVEINLPIVNLNQKVNMEFKKVLDEAVTAEYIKNLKNGLEVREARSNAILTAIINNDPQGILNNHFSKSAKKHIEDHLQIIAY